MFRSKDSIFQSLILSFAGIAFVAIFFGLYKGWVDDVWLEEYMAGSISPVAMNAFYELMFGYAGIISNLNQWIPGISWYTIILLLHWFVALAYLINLILSWSNTSSKPVLRLLLGLIFFMAFCSRPTQFLSFSTVAVITGFVAIHALLIKQVKHPLAQLSYIFLAISSLYMRPIGFAVGGFIVAMELIIYHTPYIHNRLKIAGILLVVLMASLFIKNWVLTDLMYGEDMVANFRFIMTILDFSCHQIDLSSYSTEHLLLYKAVQNFYIDIDHILDPTFKQHVQEHMILADRISPECKVERAKFFMGGFGTAYMEERNFFDLFIWSVTNFLICIALAIYSKKHKHTLFFLFLISLPFGFILLLKLTEQLFYAIFIFQGLYLFKLILSDVFEQNILMRWTRYLLLLLIILLGIFNLLEMHAIHSVKTKEMVRKAEIIKELDNLDHELILGLTSTTLFESSGLKRRELPTHFRTYSYGEHQTMMNEKQRSFMRENFGSANLSDFYRTIQQSPSSYRFYIGQARKQFLEEYLKEILMVPISFCPVESSSTPKELKYSVFPFEVDLRLYEICKE